MARPRGTPNKATQAAREAIAAFVDGNAGKLQGWLDQVAKGVPKPDAPGEFVVAPNPSKAFELFQSVIEYHVPKLARTEVTGENGGPVQYEAQVTFVRPPPRAEDAEG